MELYDRWPAVADAEELGFDVARLERVRGVCRQVMDAHAIRGMAIAVARGGSMALSEAFGVAGADADAPPATPETVWLLASITKPFTASAICLLAERGELQLSDPVTRYLPDFAAEGKGDIQLLHLLTHTSGLPDMLPNNNELRQQHAPHERFVEEICQVGLLFPPGAGVSYQSMGIATLAHIVELITGERLRDFLKREFFQPLGMSSSALGWDPALADRVATADLSPAQLASDWGWNSHYWRDFGAPWGGMFATATDVALFLEMLAGMGEWDGQRIFAPRTVEAMSEPFSLWLTKQIGDAPWGRVWGLGWALSEGAPPEFMGDLVGKFAFGHAGATGTCAWHDGDTDITCVILTNKPGTHGVLGRISNAVIGACVE